MLTALAAEVDTPLSKRGAIAAALVAALAGLVYVNAIDNPFVYDDWRVVVENRSLLDLSNTNAVLLHDRARPLVNLTYAIDRAVWGPEPHGFHLTNILLHMVNVTLLFMLAWRFSDDWRQRSHERSDHGRSMIVALTASVLLAVHPMMTQAVGYISARPEVLCTTYVLLAHVAIRRALRWSSLAWLAIAVVCWVAAMLSKETAIMFPFVVFAYELLLFPGAVEERRRRFVRIHLPLIGLASFVIALRLWLFALVEHPGEPLDTSHLLVGLDAIRTYIRLLLFPSGQAIFHAVPDVRGFGLGAAVTITALLALLGVIWVCRRGAGLVSFGVAWFLLRLVPSIALVSLDRGEPLAEHRVYLASCGFFLACGAIFAWLARRMSARRSRLWRLLRVAAVLGIVTMAAYTVLRNAVWDDPVALWMEASARAPGHWLPELMIGQALQREGRCNEAIPAFIKTVRANPREPAGYSGLGACLLEVGDVKGGRGVFEELKNLRPQLPEAWNGLGTAALLEKDIDTARQHFQQSLDYDPANVAARRGLAAVAEARDDAATALRYCEEIGAMAPETAGNDECIRRNRARVHAAGAGGS